MIRVVIIEDSPVAREVLKRILSSDPEIDVVGTATNGQEGVEAVAALRPDVVTMDIIMPKMDGYQATRLIMETTPVPIVVVSASFVREEVAMTWKAVEAGAVAVLEKPRFTPGADASPEALKLVQTVKVMSQVRVVRRWKRDGSSPLPVAAEAPPAAPAPTPARRGVSLVAIGASTGGPAVLLDIFSRLPAGFGAPIVFVQHIAPGFAQGFVDWMNQKSNVRLKLAEEGETARPGSAYMAPDGLQMGVDKRFHITLKADDPINGLRPSVSYLFQSVADSFGDQTAAVLLTGMGRDGAPELRTLRTRGAVTIAQNKETSIVYGMPGEAEKLGAAKYFLAPAAIADMLIKLVS